MEKLTRCIEKWINEAGGTWGIVLEDLNEGVRWEHNEDRLFYAASMIKLPIMAAVFAAASRGDFRLTDSLTVKKDDIVGGSGVLQHLSPELKLPIYDLVTLMIIQSDNTATNMLIDLVGFQEIRNAMQNLGMEDSTCFTKLMTVPVERPGRNMVTARDLNRLLKKLATGQFVSLYACEHMIDIMKKQQFRDCLPSLLPDDDPDIVGTLPTWEFANKTGWVTGIRHDGGILYVGERALAITVLSESVDDRQAKATMGKIGRAAYEYLLTPSQKKTSASI
jgi:beta-lactamase class A